ncbi:MAG: hypothetical protein ABIN94_00525 [Ferruginibacter sp.]
MNNKINQDVYTLLCHKDMPMAAITVPLIMRSLNPDQKFIICDDGSFDAGDIEKLSGISSSIRIITKQERDGYVLEIIGNRPNSLKYRKEFPLAFKLFDIPILARQESSRFTYTDSDIIYVKNSKAYFNRQLNTYLQTDAIKLSLKLQAGLLKYNWNIPLRFNSGYFSFDPVDYDADFLEYYLGLPDIRNIPWLIEQTAWALLFGKAGESYSPNPNQFICRENFDGPTDETLAIHLIAGLKNKYTEWAPQENITTGIQPQFNLSRNITKWDWVVKSVKRVVG